MQSVTLYTSPVCPYCSRAKQLLKQKGVEQYNEIDISQDDAKRDEMMSKAQGRRTVPQIFIGDQHVGGCDDLYALEREGKLDALLAS